MYIGGLTPYLQVSALLHSPFNFHVESYFKLEFTRNRLRSFVRSFVRSYVRFRSFVRFRSLRSGGNVLLTRTCTADMLRAINQNHTNIGSFLVFFHFVFKRRTCALLFTLFTLEYRGV